LSRHSWSRIYRVDSRRLASASPTAETEAILKRFILNNLKHFILMQTEHFGETSVARTLEEVKNQLLQITREFKRQLSIYDAAIRHPQTPRLARWLLIAAIVYVASPIDLIPDFIPVLGHLDDLIIIPALVALAVRLIPQDVLAECRKVR
jgi:uncharacterized membrane protein YkvA (DUF1232 family)